MRPRKTLAAWAAALTVFLVFGQAGFARTSKARAIDDFLKPFVESRRFSGVILAAENGRVIFEKGFGLAVAEFGVPNRPDTRIGIASITKLMTVVILNRLVEEGKIGLDDKLAEYIPDFPKGDRISIEMLSRHRSGIPHRVMRPEEESLPHTSAEFVEKVKNANLLFEPGAQSLYSSAGYAVLARALELASGQTYAELLRRYVFGPAGMTDSVDFDSEAIMDRRAQDYLPDASGMVNASLKDYSFLVGAGSVFSTARDVYRFGEAVAGGALGENARAALVKDNVLSGSGSTNGHRAFLKINAAGKYGYAILANLNSGAYDLVMAGVEAILEGKEPGRAAPEPKIIPNPNRDLSEFAGRYEREGGGGTTDFAVRNGLLVQNGVNKLYPVRPDGFFEYRYYGEVRFIRDDKGRVTGLEWTGTGFKLNWIKK